MSYIPAELRRTVVERAKGCCEYCLIHQNDHYLSHEVDHIVSIKHRGETATENLCLSCFDCNRNKGSDIGSFDLDTDEFSPLFNSVK
jgi:5-methylcytosine-specific restriction endonuclease McrA